MNRKLSTALAIAFVALSATASAQDSAEAARQQRMDAAYSAHLNGASTTNEEDRARHERGAASGKSSGSVRQDARAAGHSFHQGLRETGHAIHQGLRKTGHAIHQGAKATGHAIHQGYDKVTGK